MSDQVFRLPDVGEGLTEAEILRWLVQPGDQVDVNEMLVEIETAKAAVELPSPFRGTVQTIHVQAGDLVAVGTPIITITVTDREAVLVGYGAHDAGIRRRRRAAPSTAHGGMVRAKPLVRKLARERGIDLASVTPTGRHGEVTRADLDASGSRISVRGVQRAMAEAMTTSATTAPQATIWLDVDMSNAVARLEAMRSNLRITPLALVASAVIEATREYPVLNALWTNDGHIDVHDHVHLGIAVDSPRGLLVPSVKNAQSLDMSALAEAINELVQTARSGRCTPEQLTGSTITITNVGVFGVDGGTPLLNPGEAAIVGMGRMQDRPWVVDGNLVVRPVMTVMMTFDHRIIDGATGSKALTWIAAALQRP
jgi:2-oxoisovalerate dehydrogenase E2 component (dihydrolipoyl transacylase)